MLSLILEGEITRRVRDCCSAARLWLRYDNDMPTLKQYNAEVDEKRRITLRGTKFRKFVVTHDKNGNIILQPRSAHIVKPLAIVSVRTLKMMDRAMDNFRNGKVSKPIDLSPPVFAK